MNKNSGKMYSTTGFRNGGRRAGDGMVYDDYSEESSGRGEVRPWVSVRLPNDDVKPEELNGPCIIVQEGKRKD